MASVRKRVLADGSARYDVTYRDPDGRQRKKTFRKARSASAFGNTTEADKERGQWIDPNAGKVLFKAYAESWRAIQTFDPSTRIQVELRLRLHVYPVLGRRQLRNIKPSTVQSWSKTMARLAPRTRSLIFGHVSAILSAAVADEVLAKNPCKAPSVSAPTWQRRKVTPWPADRVVAVREALAERYRPVVVTGGGLGLRQGESFGLSPDDIDWLRGTVLVQRQVKLIGHHQVFAPPKYDKEREVPLPASVRDWLAAYLTIWPARLVTLPWREPGGKPITVRLLMTTRESRAVERNYFNKAIWKPALVAVGVEPTRENGTHILRHTFASVLLDAGESILALSEYLGHADPGFTLRVYTHLMPSSAERTRNAVDGMFGTTEGQPPHVTDMSQDGG